MSNQDQMKSANPSATKKRLGQSILKSISSSSNDSQAFKEASENNLEQEIQPALEIPVPTPKPIPKPMKNKSSGGKILPIVIGLLILILMAGLFVNHKMIQGIESNTTAEFKNSASKRGLISEGVTNLVVEGKALSRTVKTHDNQINILNGRVNKVEKLTSQFNAMKTEFSEINEKLNEQAIKIQKNQESINTLVVQFKKQNKRPAITRKRKTVTRAPNINYQLEDATLVGIDVWGSTYNAVLRNEGTWIPLSIGGIYKGWKFTKVDSPTNRAVFVRQGETKKLSIKE